MYADLKSGSNVSACGRGALAMDKQAWDRMRMAFAFWRKIFPCRIKT